MITIFFYNKTVKFNINTILAKKLIVKFFYNNNEPLNYINRVGFIYYVYKAFLIRLHSPNTFLSSFLYLAALILTYGNNFRFYINFICKMLHWGKVRFNRINLYLTKAEDFNIYLRRTTVKKYFRRRYLSLTVV